MMSPDVGSVLLLKKMRMTMFRCHSQSKDDDLSVHGHRSVHLRHLP
jgi:hypothetical protein